tara:strand:- start:557 stop:793 length:237 start_codon:yes stop_codon:yes gene_type:complete
MVNLYSRDVVISVLDECLVRNDIKRKYKIDKIKDNTTTDNSNDRNYKIIKEVKKEDTKTLNKRCMKELKKKLDNIKEV